MLARADFSRSVRAGRIIRAAVLFYVLVAVLMHVLQPSTSFVAMPMSAYVLGSCGFLMTMTFFALSLALLATWYGLRDRLAGSWQSRVGLFFILLGAAATAVAGIFPDDGLQPPLLPITTTGWVHLGAGMFAFPSFLLGPILVSLAIRNEAEWRRRIPAILTTSVLLVLAAIWFIIAAAPNGMAGLAQRVLLVLLCVWLLLIASGMMNARRSSSADSLVSASK